MDIRPGSFSQNDPEFQHGDFILIGRDGFVFIYENTPQTATSLDRGLINFNANPDHIEVGPIIGPVIFYWIYALVTLVVLVTRKELRRPIVQFKS